MLRLLVIVFYLISGLARCDDVEIADEEAPPPSTMETSAKENDFVGAPGMSAMLAFVDPAFGLRETSGPISLVAGKQASIVVSLENQHPSKSFSLYSIEAALHYPRYYGYHIQNFTVQRQHNVLEPKQQTSLSYSFTPSVQLAGQHFDLAVILSYFDLAGKPYLHSTFNETISILEDEEVADFEIIFLGILMALVTLIAAFGIWHWVSTKTVKRSTKTTTDIQYFGENEYSGLKKKVLAPKHAERANGAVNRRQGKK